jgi:hypothetical protein
MALTPIEGRAAAHGEEEGAGCSTWRGGAGGGAWKEGWCTGAADWRVGAADQIGSIGDGNLGLNGIGVRGEGDADCRVGRRCGIGGGWWV